MAYFTHSKYSISICLPTALTICLSCIICNLFFGYKSHIFCSRLFWSSLVGIVMQRSIEYSVTPMQDQCSTDITKATSYGGYNYETNMLILGLMALSWLKVNIQKKTENGHCRNPIHNKTKNKPIGCSIGSKFHKKLYDDYESLLENFISSVKDCTPVSITSSKENGAGNG